MKMYFLLILSVLSLGNSCLVARHNTHKNDSNNYPFKLRNFDFPIGGPEGFGEVIFNPANIEKRSFRYDDSDIPVTWTSKYNSITFNLLSKDFPQDGLNEAGLGAAVTVLKNQFHTNSKEVKDSIAEMELIQYILDNCATVEETIDMFRKQDLKMVKISNMVIKGRQLNFHWSICDKTGECMYLEYVRDEFVWKKYNSTELFIMTNNYTPSLEEEYSRLNPKELPIPSSFINQITLPRYTNARYYLENFDENRDVVLEGFNLLDASTKDSWNKWQTVTDLKNGIIYFRSLVARNIKRININDFKELNQTLTISMHTKKENLTSSDFRPIDLKKEKSNLWTGIVIMEQPSELAEAIYQHIYEYKSNGSFVGKFGENLKVSNFDWCWAGLTIIWNTLGYYIDMLPPQNLYRVYL